MPIIRSVKPEEPKQVMFANMTNNEYFVCENNEQANRFTIDFFNENLCIGSWKNNDSIIIVPNHLKEKILREHKLIYIKEFAEKKAPETKEILVVNMTTDEFFICEDDSQMKRFMSELFNHTSFGTHWQRTDKIKIVPEHLNEYVKNKYAMLYMGEYMEKNCLYMDNHWERGEAKELL